VTGFTRLVYFAQRADGSGPIKIGSSVCPRERVKQLGFDHAERFTVLLEAHGGLAAERMLHRRFARSRVGVPTYREGREKPIAGWTEWYEPTAELLKLISDLKAGGIILPFVDDRAFGIAAKYLYVSGSTLESVAADYGITRERVRQILKEHGYPSNPGARTQYLRAQRAAA
jgi:hypothetical protein